MKKKIIYLSCLFFVGSIYGADDRDFYQQQDYKYSLNYDQNTFENKKNHQTKDYKIQKKEDNFLGFKKNINYLDLIDEHKKLLKGLGDALDDYNQKVNTYLQKCKCNESTKKEISVKPQIKGKNSLLDHFQFWKSDSNFLESARKNLDSIKDAFCELERFLEESDIALKNKSVLFDKIKKELTTDAKDEILPSLIIQLNKNYNDVKKNFPNYKYYFDFYNQITKQLDKYFFSESKSLLPEEKLRIILDENVNLRKKNSEMSDILNKYESENKALSDNLKKISDELKNSNSILENEKSKYENIKNDLFRLEKNYKEKEKKLNEANSQVNKNNDDLIIKNKKIDSLERDKRDFIEEIKLKEQEIAILKKTIIDGKEMMNSGQKNLNEYLKKEEESRNLQIKNYFNELNDIKKKNSLLIEENNKLKKVNEDFEKKLVEVEQSKKVEKSDGLTNVEALKEEIDNLKQENCQLQKSLIQQKPVAKFGQDPDSKKIDTKIRDLIPNIVTKICERSGVAGDKLDSNINMFIDDDLSLLDLLKKFEEFSKKMNF